MGKSHLIIVAVVALILIFGISTIGHPILVVAEDLDEGGGGGLDMAASFSLTGFEWIYPGSSVNSNGETLHNIHLISPENPYGAAKEIMEYSYNVSPFLIVSVNNAAGEAVFGGNIIDNIRANDAYNGYAGNENVQGTMSRGDAVGTAMFMNGINFFEVPIQILLGNIRLIPV